MASTSKKSKVLKTFNYPVKVEVQGSVFEPLASIVMLDLTRLNKGSHKIEIGFAKGGMLSKVGLCDHQERIGDQCGI